MEPSHHIRQRLVRFQKDEETGSAIYAWMSARADSEENRQILRLMADDEKNHAAVWKRITGVEVAANRGRLLWLKLLTLVLGFTFVLKRMEREENFTAGEYRDIVQEVPEAREMIIQEERHEGQLMAMLDEERLHYVGAMVLGLNDALVELTGTIAGLTLALAHTRLVALAGIITGVSATLSMAASNYLAERADGKADAFKSCIYTGIAYLVTVVLLVTPYLLLPDTMYLTALGAMLATVVLIIFAFTYYIAVAKTQPFARRFWEMAGISLGVAVVSFGIGLAAKAVLGVDL